ncbi:GNAT family N-acetyltransferase [Streptomyces sp. NPDC059740]|uniref:GNAT family N-acetyltransferase n=1 Tax=Streptomyces sp. NPDC059740 TaxID=3346926 RepID=UPI0036579CFE
MTEAHTDTAGDTGNDTESETGAGTGPATGRPPAAAGASSPILRPRTAADLEACVAALAEVHARDGYPTRWPADPAGWLAGTGVLDARVAVVGGRVVGHVALHRPAPDDSAPALWSAHSGQGPEGTAVVGRLFVSPAGRGGGLGGLLLAEAARQARSRGRRAVLDVVAADPAATFYARLGWTPLGLTEQHWAAGLVVPVRCYAAPDL